MAARDFSALPPRRRLEALEKIARQLRRLTRKWGASYIGVGRRHRNDTLRDEWCIKVFVPAKLETPSGKRAIPPVIVRRVRLGGKRYSVRVPTDVVVAARAVRPQAQAGDCASIYNEHCKEEQGAATALVDGRETERRFLLAAAHVVARTLSVTNPTAGEGVMQTGDLPLGTLSYAPRMQERPIDAALVELTASSNPTFLRRTAPVTKVCPESDLLGQPMGSYSLLSWRYKKPMTFVTWLYDFPVPGVYAGGDVVFPKLMQFEGAAKGGDSGALIVDNQNRAVGMHILGIPDEQTSFCLPVSSLLSSLHPDEELEITG